MGCSSSSEVRAISPSFNREQSVTRITQVKTNHTQQHHQNQQHANNQSLEHCEPAKAQQTQDEPPPNHTPPQNQQHVNHQSLERSEPTRVQPTQDEPPSSHSPPQDQTPSKVNDQHSSVENPPPSKPPKEESQPFLNIRAPSQRRNPRSGLAVDKVDYEGLESKIAISNAILTQEGYEDMKKRLSTYGVYAETYNARELAEHNNKCGYWDLLIFHTAIISMPALYDLCLPYTLAIERTRLFEHDPDLPESDFPDFWQQHSFKKPYRGAFIALLNDGLDSRTISLCMKKCQISALRKDKKEEAEDLKQDINVLIEEISGARDSSQNLSEYRDQLRRACEKFSLGSNVETDETKSAGDWNQKAFPLPEIFLKNPKLIRNWIENWEIFDTTVKEGDGWDFSLKQWEVFEKDSDEMKIDNTKLHRTELDELPALDLSIEGEAGWGVIPVDIVKDDVTTPQQEKTWEAREKRTNLNDPVHMEKRRMAIEKYFLTTYADRFTWASKRVEGFRCFADNLKKAEQEFQELCEKS